MNEFQFGHDFACDVVCKNSNDRTTKRNKRNTIGQETISKKRDVIGQETKNYWSRFIEQRK